MSTQALDYQAADDVLAEIARLRAENAALKASKPRTSLSLKVSEKGAVSVYGMGRFPVTLYAEQWTRLLAQGEAIAKFIEANKGRLSVKADKAEAGETADKGGF